MRLKTRTFAFAFSSASLVASTSACSAEWDLPIAYPSGNYHTEAAESFSHDVKSLTDGEITITVHPSGSLFKGDEIYTAVRRGLVPIGERLISALGNEDPVYEVDAIPFLATSFEEARELYQASRDELESTLSEHGLKLLYSIPWPPQGLYANTQVNSIADLEGVKLRAYNNATVRLAQEAGAIPSKIEAADLSQAFSTGVVNGMFSSGSTGFDSKLWEHIHYWYDVKAWLPKGMVFINNNIWSSLSSEEQQAILEASENVEAAGWERAEELASWYKEQLSENGMTVFSPSEQLNEDFQKIGEDMAKAWLERSGDQGQRIMDAYRPN